MKIKDFYEKQDYFLYAVVENICGKERIIAMFRFSHDAYIFCKLLEKKI